MLVRPSTGAIEALVRAALLEDAPWGDVTCQTFLTPEDRVRPQLVARQGGVLCGEDVFAAAMRLTDASIRVGFRVHDGERFEAGAVLAEMDGPAQGVLQAERVALNFVQRLSGIATMTAAFVAETAGTVARIVDTRKTTPGLRVLERYAVRCGGGHNHRFSLSDAVMVKDNHLAVIMKRLGVGRAEALTEFLRAAKATLPHTTHVEAEVDREEQIEPMLAAGVDSVLLDNFSTEGLRAAVELIRGRAVVEASGTMRLERIREVAATGVDVISVGVLTHSVRALDLGLDMDSAAE